MSDLRARVQQSLSGSYTIEREARAPDIHTRQLHPFHASGIAYDIALRADVYSIERGAEGRSTLELAGTRETGAK